LAFSNPTPNILQDLHAQYTNTRSKLCLWIRADQVQSNSPNTMTGIIHSRPKLPVTMVLFGSLVGYHIQSQCFESVIFYLYPKWYNCSSKRLTWHQTYINKTFATVFISLMLQILLISTISRIQILVQLKDLTGYTMDWNNASLHLTLFRQLPCYGKFAE
jgi:hypothetical protein